MRRNPLFIDNDDYDVTSWTKSHHGWKELLWYDLVGGVSHIVPSSLRTSVNKTVHRPSLFQTNATRQRHYPECSSSSSCHSATHHYPSFPLLSPPSPPDFNHLLISPVVRGNATWSEFKLSTSEERSDTSSWERIGNGYRSHSSNPPKIHQG